VLIKRILCMVWVENRDRKRVTEDGARSANPTPCLPLFADSFFGSHSKATPYIAH
jgi:hypothetical protein